MDQFFRHGLDWVDIEFSSLKLVDERLKSRFLKMMRTFLSNSQDSICMACNSWKDSKGSYRFLGNKRFNESELLVPHRQKSLERSLDEKVVLALHDTTYFNYDSFKKTEGLGSIGANINKGFKGLIAQNTLLVNELGDPLGLPFQKIYAREKPVRHEVTGHKGVPIQKKESYRWVEGFNQVSNLFKESDSQVISIADRESDIYELIHESVNNKILFAIRSSWNRSLKTDRKKYEEQYKIHDHLQTVNACGTIDIGIKNAKTNKLRQVSLEVKFTNALLKRPQRSREIEALNGKLSDVSVSIVQVKETNNTVDPVHWTLYTNMEVNDLKDAIKVVNWYKQRWQIECFHKVLKTGCNVEKARLGDEKKLKKYITMMSIVAWRIYYLSLVSRNHQAQKADTIFTEDEIDALFIREHHKKRSKNQLISIKQVTLWIAKLGGYLARNSDPPPGPTVLWRGIKRLEDIKNDYLIFKKLSESCG